MSQVRDRDTKPEIVVRSVLHRLGHRFRLHDARLPGRPDIVLRRHKKIIQVHGCFWHQHPGCPAAARPTTHVAFWTAKLDANERRDARVMQELRNLGWTAKVIWECETRDGKMLRDILVEFMEDRE